MPTEIPFYDFSHQNETIWKDAHRVLSEVFDSAWYILGDRGVAFEREYAQYLGVKHCIGVGNGLDALKISLCALGIGIGDEVIVPANTYIATILAVTSVGAIPVLVEPNIDTFNIDPSKIKAKITAKTKAILPVHLYGLPCAMDEIMTIAEEYGLHVVEDNAQAAGANYKGKKTGTIGHINAHSFYPTKNLGAIGDGGAVTTNDDGLAKRVRLLRNYGSEVKYQNDLLGYNSRLDEVQAAVLSLKLPHLDRWNQERRALALEYYERLNKTHEIDEYFRLEKEGTTHAYHLLVLKTKERDQLAAALKAHQVNTLIHYPIPAYRQKAYAGQFDPKAYPITDLLSSEVLSFPLYPGMSTKEVQYIADLLRGFNH